MREHCRTQHGFDPLPKPGPRPGGSSALTFRKDEVFERFLKMVRNSLVLEDLGTGKILSNEKMDSVRERNNALVYLADNFVFLSKKDVKALSGFVCEYCLSFQYRFIKDMGTDLTAKAKHRCRPATVEKVRALPDKIARLDQIRTRALNSLVELGNSVWSGKKYLIATSDLPPKFLRTFHAPLITMSCIKPDHWAWKKIVRKRVNLTDIGFKRFIERTGGTYAVIIVEEGIHAGEYLMYVTGSKS